MTAPRIVALLAAVVLVVSIGVLMMTDIPVKQHPVEKSLDAKAFLEQK